MDEKRALESVREIVIKAMEERRGLVAYSRLEAIELDRRAREVEREALEQVRQALPTAPVDEQLYGITSRLRQMVERLEELSAQDGIPERSRGLEEDDVRWRAFEDISWALGIG